MEKYVEVVLVERETVSLMACGNGCQREKGSPTGG